MRLEIETHPATIKITTLFVTSRPRGMLLNLDKVAVMNNNGIIEQYGTPEEIYQHPTTEFVARFIDLKTSSKE